jgi:hypothetical protein
MKGEQEQKTETGKGIMELRVKGIPSWDTGPRGGTGGREGE